MIIDMHAHFIPAPYTDRLRRQPGYLGARLEQREDGEWMRHEAGYTYPLLPGFQDPAAIATELDRRGEDAEIASISPTLFAYDAGATAVDFCREANDWAADLCKRLPGRLRAMCSVPLPDVVAACAELERARALGLVACEIGTVIGSTPLDHPELRPFFRRAADLGMPLFLHPYYTGPKPGLTEFYFVNSIGNPLDTTLSIARLVHGGVFAELPHLKVIGAHGGGYYPYQRGRFEHAWKVRREPKVVIDRPPSAYMGGVYYDTLTHDPVALEFLVRAVGADHVLLGSDYPFDMGPDQPLAVCREASLGEDAYAAVTGQNALRLFGLQ